MECKKVNKRFTKGLALIIGKMKGKIMKTDGVILNTASTLSNEPQLIENAKITDEDKIIYLCGHGNVEKQTIGGKKLSEIAKLLVRAGYRGIQDIYITACESAKVVNGNSMEEELKDAIKDTLRIKELLREIDSIDNISKLKINVYSYSDGNTVVFQGDTDEIEIWILKSNSFKSHALLTFRSLQQKSYLNKIGASKVEINIENSFSHILKHSEGLRDKINEYKRHLAVAEWIRNDEESLLSYASMIYTLVVTMIGVLIGIYIDMQINYRVASIISMIAVLIIKFTIQTLINKRRYEKINTFTILLTLKSIAYSIIVCRVLF